MKAVQLSDFAGLESLKVVEIDRPTPSIKEVLIQVKAAGINSPSLRWSGADIQRHGHYLLQWDLRLPE